MRTEMPNFLCRVGQNHIYMVILAGKSTNIRSYTVCIYGSGQSYFCDIMSKAAQHWHARLLCFSSKYCAQYLHSFYAFRARQHSTGMLAFYVSCPNIALNAYIPFMLFVQGSAAQELLTFCCCLSECCAQRPTLFLCFLSKLL